MNKSMGAINQIHISAKDEAENMELAQIDPSNVDYFERDTVGYYLARLRRDDPVHFCNSPVYGPYWSVTRYKDIIQVDTNHRVFSSDWSNGGALIYDVPEEERLQNFLNMDPPQHTLYRKALNPVVGSANLRNIENVIRTNACEILDSLPRNQTFDWVDCVSTELSTRMMALLFNFPFDDRHLLTRWSDLTTFYYRFDSKTIKNDTEHMVTYFTRLWEERANSEPGFDFISMMAHSPGIRNMTAREFMGNLRLLIFGGIDTVRNSITGGLFGLLKSPTQWQKLREHPDLIENMVSEIIRWQTPLAHMRRTALEDIELGGKTIRKGDKVVMWYVSGNKDDEAFVQADQFQIDRIQVPKHLSFGYGIHHCIGSRLGEMQLRILWEEIHKRFSNIEIVEEPVRIRSCFVRGFSNFLVRIPL